MFLERVVAYAALSAGIIAVELALASRMRSAGKRRLALLTDQLMIFSTFVSLGVGLIGSLVFRPAHLEPAWPAFALGLAAGTAGLVVRASAMRTLGREYTLTPRAESHQELISTGLYRLVRHPGYAGIVLSILGLQLILGTWLAVVSTLFVVLTVPVRIRVEEDMLLERFGPEYVAYQSRTRYRLLPGLY